VRFPALNRHRGIGQNKVKKKILRYPFSAKLRFEPLEERRLLSFGGLLHTLADPGVSLQSGCFFGRAVAADGNRSVVGASGTDLQGNTEVGRAYVIDTTTGALMTTLSNPSSITGDQFGYSVAISGNIVVVGTPYNDTGQTDSGIVYIFNATTGNLVHTLANPTPSYYDYFGVSVAISGQIVVVGASGEDKLTANAVGAAYIFDADTGNLLHTLANPSPVANDFFGMSVAVSGNNVVVGAYYDDTSSTDSGEAYIFDATTGSLVRTLSNPTPAGDDRFGYSVAVSGDTVLVGAPRDDTAMADGGAVHIFDTVSGNLLNTLTNPTSSGNDYSDYFGCSVAISGDSAIIGAYSDNTGATDTGMAYIYDVSNGSISFTLHNPSPANGDNFGYSVSVSGDTVIVGTLYDDTGAADAGAVYVFDGSTGALSHALIMSTPAASDYFGSSTAISDNTLVVGAYCDDTGATDSGVVHVFNAATGNLIGSLANPTPAISDKFGYSVAISGNNLVVGAYQDDTGATDAGAAYIFDATTGNLLHTLADPTPEINDWFGYSVAISGNLVVVGAYMDDTGATNSGTTYIFNANTGSLLRALANPTPSGGDYFGSSVAISGNNVIVGAYSDNTGATDSGAAYIFDASNGNLLYTLANPAPAANDKFGFSVAVSGNIAVVGAYQDDLHATNNGTVYVYDLDAGNLLHTLSRPEWSINDYFGYSVAVSGNVVAVGTPGEDTGATDAGETYLFDATTGNLLGTISNPTPSTTDMFGYTVVISSSIVAVGAPYEDGDTTDRGAAYVFLVRSPESFIWDGGSTVNNKWSTSANWSGDAAPLSGDSLVFPAGAEQMDNANDYPSSTLFGSITVSGSGYCFQNGGVTTTSMIVQPGKQLETDKIVADTLTIGAGAKVTITPIAGGTLGTLSAHNNLQHLASNVISPIVSKIAIQASLTSAAATAVATSNRLIDAAIESRAITVALNDENLVKRREQAPGLNDEQDVYNLTPNINRLPLQSLIYIRINNGVVNLAINRAKKTVFAEAAKGDRPIFVDTKIGTVTDFAELRTNGFTRSVKSTIVEKSGAEVDLDIARHARVGNHARQLEKVIDSVIGEDEDLFPLL
jgi:hypothetical protein